MPRYAAFLRGINVGGHRITNDELLTLDVDVLVAAFNSVLARIPPRPVVISGRTWTLEEKLDVITERLRKGPIELIELILESEDRLEAVITFVAVLELLRRSLVSVRQKERFGPIHVEAKQPAGE